MTVVKICGLTRPEDVAFACALGAHYVGFNFAQSSPRRVSPEAARALADAVPAGVLKVGVFKSESAAAIDRAVALARLDLVQLHRALTGEDVDRSGLAVIAVAGEGGEIPSARLLRRCHAILLDTSEGRGRPFDPLRVRPRRWPVPVFVAGGLDADSVGPVIRALKPAAVDVATGAESSPGVKDRDKLARFFDAVREADRETG